MLTQATALLWIGKNESKVHPLEQAIQIYREVLEVITPASDPGLRITLQTYLSAAGGCGCRCRAGSPVDV